MEPTEDLVIRNPAALCKLPPGDLNIARKFNLVKELVHGLRIDKI